MAMSPTGKGCRKCYASASKSLANSGVVGSFETGSKSNVASESPAKAGVLLVLGQQPASGCTMSICSNCFLFSEAVGSPHRNGVALQDMKLGAGGRFLGSGSREI